VVDQFWDVITGSVVLGL